MFRKFELYLENWKQSPNRKPMIVRGARQVGKTFTIRKFGNEHFKYFLELNLEQKNKLSTLFESMDIEQIANELTILYQTPIINGETLLFIDEIQLAPKAIAALRYFFEQRPGLHVIAAGSLLDHTLNEMPYSMPVGRVEFAYMYPLTFMEFLLAHNEKALWKVIESYKPGKKFSEVLHQKIAEYLRLYFYIGGMPEAVHIYLKTKKILEVAKVHSAILSSIEFDFAKYGTRKQQEYLKDVLNYCAHNVGRKVKYVSVNKNANSALLKDAFNKLKMSRIIHLTYSTKSSAIPLSKYVNNNVFKPVFFDIGLVCRLAGIKLNDLRNLASDFEGNLAEQFVGQELAASGDFFEEQSLYYWMRDAKNANAEIDYLYQIGNRVFPIEVKAGKRGTLKSLHVYLAEKNMKLGIRLNMDLPSYGKKMHASTNLPDKAELNYSLLSLPIYMASQLNNYVLEE